MQWHISNWWENYQVCKEAFCSFSFIFKTQDLTVYLCCISTPTHRPIVAMPPAGWLLLIWSTRCCAEMSVSSRPACDQCCYVTAGSSPSAFSSPRWLCDGVTVAMRFQLGRTNQSAAHWPPAVGIQMYVNTHALTPNHHHPFIFLRGKRKWCFSTTECGLMKCDFMDSCIYCYFTAQWWLSDQWQYNSHV